MGQEDRKTVGNIVLLKFCEKIQLNATKFSNRSFAL